MFGFLRKKWPLSNHQADSESRLPATKSDPSPDGLHREMIRGVFSELTRGHDIAPDTLVFDFFPLRRRSGEKEMHVQLNMLKWNESLLYQAPMLQHQMQLELARYASKSGISAFVVTWKFAPACLTFALPQTNHQVQQHREAVKMKKELPLFDERQFCPQTSVQTTMDASLFEPCKKPSAFLPTEVNSIR